MNVIFVEPLRSPRLLCVSASRFRFKWTAQGRWVSVASYNAARYTRLEFPHFPRVVRDSCTGTHPVERIGVMRR